MPYDENPFDKTLWCTLIMMLLLVARLTMVEATTRVTTVVDDCALDVVGERQWRR